MRRWFAIGAGTLAVLALAVWLVVLPAIVVRAVRIPLEATPKAFGVAYRDVAFPTRGGGLTLRGWWMPTAGARAVVIFVHGGNGNRRDFYAGALEMEAFLAGHHYDVLAFDQRNHGTSDATPDGQIMMGVEESRDALGAVDFARKQAPGLPVVLLADSMGGATAIYAAHDDADIAGLMLIDPVLDEGTVVTGALYADLGLPHALLPAIAWSARTFFAHKREARDALREGEELKQPILLIGDDRDPVCLPRFAQALALANPNVTFWISRDPDRPAGRWGYHTGAYKLHRPDVERLLLGFLARHAA